MNGFVAWALARLGERSTYSGIAAVVAGMTFLPHASADAELLVALGIVVSGALDIVRREKGAPK